MPRPTIDYLNARREAKRSTAGGKTYSRLINPVDVRARDAELDTIDRCHDQVLAIFADFRSWFAESSRALHAGNLDTMEDGYVPF